MFGVSVAARFWAKVAIVDDGCWEWRASRSGNGYGMFKLHGRSRGAHVIAFLLANGDVPEGMWVLHHCDNVGCVRPDHLYAGSHTENVADRDRRGRTLSGERHGSARVSDADIAEIRRLYSTGAWTQSALAQRFDVSQAWISCIVRQVWRRCAA